MLKHVEYAYYDFDVSDRETKDNILTAIKYSPNTISVLPQCVKSIKKIIPEHIQLSAIIDYPLGLSNFTERFSAIKTAIRDGAKCIEVVCPNYLLCNRKYDKFKSEIDDFKNLCFEQQIDLKYVLEYKIFTSTVLNRIANILYTKKLTTIYPSTSFFLDSISDNILVAMSIQQKNPGINIIINGQAWHDNQIDLILSNPNIFSYKTSNIYTLEKITHKMLKQ